MPPDSVVQFLTVDDDQNWNIHAEALKTIFSSFVAGSEAGIVCVSGKRDERKCILLNYITRYLMWLSRSQDGQDWQPSEEEETLFVKEEDDVDESGGFVWHQLFLVDIENTTGTGSQKLPLLLLDMSSATPSQLFVHVVKAKISSVQDLGEILRSVMESWDRDAHNDHSVCLIRDWATHVSQFRSKELFSLPSAGTAATSQFLASFVYHTFGSICSPDEKDHLLSQHRISRDIFFEPDGEPVVGHAVILYVQKMRELLSDAAKNKESLLVMHKRLTKEAIDQIRSINCPSQVILRRISSLNRRLTNEFSRIRQKQQQLQQDRKSFILISIHMEYVKRMRAAIQEETPLEDADILRMHQAEMRKCLTECRSQMLISETELMEWTNPTFLLLQRINSEARYKIYSSLKLTADEHLLSFTEQMRKGLADFKEIIPQTVDRMFSNIQARSLMTFQSSLNSMNINPAMKRNLMKDLETQMISQKDLVVRQKEIALKVLRHRMDASVSKYIRLMQLKMTISGAMNQVEAQAVHEEVASEVHSEWQDEACWPQLLTSIQEQYSILSHDHMLKSQELETRVKQLVEHLLTKYEGKMSSYMSDPHLSMRSLENAHEKIRRDIFAQFNYNRDVKMAGKHLLHLGAELKKSMDESFAATRDKFEKDLDDEKLKQQVQNCFDVYNNSMEKYCKERPKTMTKLTNGHQKIFDVVMERFHINAQRVSSNYETRQHHEDSLKEKIQAAFEEKRLKVDHEMQQKEDQDEVVCAVSACQIRYRKKMDEHLKSLSRSEVSEDAVQKAHSRIQQESLSLFRSQFTDDPEADRVVKGENDLVRMTSIALGTFLKEHVQEKDTFISEIQRKAMSVVKSVVTSPKSLISHLANRSPDASAAGTSVHSNPSYEDVKRESVQSFEKQIIKFLTDHPEATQNKKQNHYNRVLNLIICKLRRSGPPERVIESVRQEINQTWQRLRNNRSLKSPGQRKF